MQGIAVILSKFMNRPAAELKCPVLDALIKSEARWFSSRLGHFVNVLREPSSSHATVPPKHIVLNTTTCHTSEHTDLLYPGHTDSGRGEGLPVHRELTGAVTVQVQLNPRSVVWQSNNIGCHDRSSCCITLRITAEMLNSIMSPSPPKNSVSEVRERVLLQDASSGIRVYAFYCRPRTGFTAGSLKRNTCLRDFTAGHGKV